MCAQVVEGSSKNIEVAVVEKDTGLRFLTDAQVDELVSAGRAGGCRGNIAGKLPCKLLWV